MRAPLVLVAPENEMTTRPDKNGLEFKAAQEELTNVLKAFEPVNVRTLPPVIQRTVAWMRSERDSAIAKNRGLEPSPEMAHDLRLLRFLIGAKWDPSKGIEMYLKALQERKKLKIDQMRDEMVGANGLFFGGRAETLHEIYFHPQAQRSAQLMPRLWADTRTPGEYRLLRDKSGNLVVAEYAPDFKKVEELGCDAYAATELEFNELQVLVLDELTVRDGILRMACRVQDSFGQEKSLGASMLPNPFAGKGECAFKASGESSKALYPTVVFKWFMVRISDSYRGTVQSAITSFGGRSAYKMIVCGSDFSAQVFSTIDRPQLPAQLGGTLPAELFAPIRK